MANINLQKYFEDTESKYYDTKILTRILVDILGKDINNIKSDIQELNVIVDEKKIREFLDEKFAEEEPEVKQRIENPQPRKRSNNIVKWTEEDIEESSREFSDELTASRYSFNTYTLNYFIKYINIVKLKSIKILSIIEKLVNKEQDSINDLLVDLDIELDENGKISKEDIIRLIPPFIHNYNSLVDKVNVANNLETYLSFGLSKHYLYKNGIFENELYPIPNIQVKNLYSNCVPDNIPLSKNQKKELEEQEKRNMKIITKSLLDW